MTRNLRIVLGILCALASWATACGPSQDAKLPPQDQGTTSIHVENQLDDPVQLRNVRVSIDGKEAGGLAGEDLGRGSREPVQIVTARLTEGDHTLTLYVQAVRRPSEDTLVLSETLSFSVGREPLSLLARLSTSPDTSSLQLDLAVKGGTLAGPKGVHASGSCHALPPGETQICLTEAALRTAMEHRDAPRVVCLDEILGQMRHLVLISGAEDGGIQETVLRREVPRRLEELSHRARRCPSAKETTALLDAGI